MPALFPSSRSASLLLAALGCLACEGTYGPLFPAPDTPDAGPPDLTPPRILGTIPGHGAARVRRDAPVRIRFSEAMDSGHGTLSIEPLGLELPADTGIWNGAHDEVALGVEEGWPPGIALHVTIHADFRDRGGLALEAEHELTFTSADDVAPRLIASRPATGDLEVPHTLDGVHLVFDEAMRDVGSVEVVSGGARAGPVELRDPRNAFVPLSDVAPSTEHSFLLVGFADRAGNPLDREEGLTDGRLDFTTAADTGAPFVIRAIPHEGSSVGLGREAVVLEMSEPMDPTAGTATLHAPGAEPLALPVSFVDSDRTVSIDVRGALGPVLGPYRIELTGLSDRSENPLDPVPVLRDGALDFVVGADPEPPRAVASTPEEGATAVSVDTVSLSVAFSEPMDTSVRNADLVGGPSPLAAAVRWSAAGTTGTFVVTDLLHAGRDYRLGLDAFRDADGTPLDASAPILRDGWLDFTTAPADGEGCRSALGVTEATEVEPGVFEWHLLRDSVRRRDAGALCGFVDASADAVIAYEKLGPDRAAGGSLLHVTAEVLDPSTARYVTVQVMGATCSPLAPGAPEPVACTAESGRWDLYLDLPAGPYHVWLARPTRSSDPYQPELRVRIEEVPVPPEGESCARPYTTTSAIHAGSGTAGDPHRWVIPGPPPGGPRTINAPDMEDGVTCDSGGQGADAVIRVPKASDDSVLEVRVRVDVPETATSSERVTRYLNVQPSDRCEAPREAMRCERRLDDGTLYVPGPAGDVHVWLAGESPIYRWPLFPVIVEVTEIPTAPGESCAAGLPAILGANAVVASSAARIEPPEVIADPTPVQWYRYTPSSDSVVVVTPGAPAPLAFVDPTDGRPIDQVSDGAVTPLARRLTGGQTVCIAAPGDGSLTSFWIEEVPYAGVASVVDLDIDFPPNSIGGCTTNLSSDYWLAATPTTLYLGISTHILEAPRTGSTTALLRGTESGVRTYGSAGTLGYAGAAVGERLFSLYGSSSTSYRRLYEMWDGASAFWAPEPYDVGASYPGAVAFAMTWDGAELLYALRTPTTQIWALSPGTEGSARPIGTVPVGNVTGMAADGEHLYLAGYHDGRQGIFRVARAELDEPAATVVPLAPAYAFALSGTDPTRAPGTGVTTPMALDDLVDPDHLYFRPSSPGEPQVVVDPDGSQPLYAGPVTDAGRVGDVAMAFDPDADAMFLFTTEGVTCGAMLRIE